MAGKLKGIAAATATLAPAWFSAYDVGTSAAVQGPKRCALGPTTSVGGLLTHPLFNSHSASPPLILGLATVLIPSQ
jgi:hypothetical protein